MPVRRSCGTMAGFGFGLGAPALVVMPWQRALRKTCRRQTRMSAHREQPGEQEDDGDHEEGGEERQGHGKPLRRGAPTPAAPMMAASELRPEDALQKRALLWFSRAQGRAAVRPVPDRCGMAASSRCLRARRCGSATNWPGVGNCARTRVTWPGSATTVSLKPGLPALRRHGVAVELYRLDDPPPPRRGLDPRGSRPRRSARGCVWGARLLWRCRSPRPRCRRRQGSR